MFNFFVEMIRTLCKPQPHITATILHASVLENKSVADLRYK